MSQILQESQGLRDACKALPTGDVNEKIDWQKRCQELTAERDSLRLELDEVKADRDTCLRAVNALLPEPEYTYTKEEIMAQVGQLPPLEDFIAELERQVEN